jgi:hypothetical protein
MAKATQIIKAYKITTADDITIWKVFLINNKGYQIIVGFYDSLLEVVETFSNNNGFSLEVVR